MMTYSIGDLIYNGERAGVHHWNTLAGTSFYWHPDWLHIAEDMTGLRSTTPVVARDDVATQADAERAIIKHLNDQE